MNSRNIRFCLSVIILAAILVFPAFSMHAQDIRPSGPGKTSESGSLEDVRMVGNIFMDDSGFSGGTTSSAPHAGSHVIRGYARYVKEGVVYTVYFTHSGLDLAAVSATFPPGSRAHSMYASHSMYTSSGSLSVLTYIGSN
ncbi:MAG: hypothetical protein QM270_10375 [Bacillota bacterium]|nr:hypothetical protein [Bacillota bacterium]